MTPVEGQRCRNIRLPLYSRAIITLRREKVYTKSGFSSENSSASTGKKEVWCIPKSLFSREKKGKTHIRQRASQVFVGDLFAEHWCIDFGLLNPEGKKPHYIAKPVCLLLATCYSPAVDAGKLAILDRTCCENDHFPCIAWGRKICISRGVDIGPP